MELYYGNNILTVFKLRELCGYSIVHVVVSDQVDYYLKFNWLRVF